MLHWLIHTDAGLAFRIAVGCGIFLFLAVTDWIRNGRAATRWREYAFLLAAVATAMAYGMLNDQITSSISWEYFYYGKELDKVLGPSVPPPAAALHWEAAKVGIEATWSAGLICGVALLLANNPRAGRPPLRNRDLLAYLPAIFLFAGVCGVVLGIVGWHGGLNRLSTDFGEMAHAHIFRPDHFVCVWGAHVGGYLGGVVGTLIGVFHLKRRRRRLSHKSCWQNY